MTAELKQKIDQAWLGTDFGKWCIALADGENEKADMLRQKMFDDGYLSILTLEDELAEKLSKLFQTESEVSEYLEMLDRENHNLGYILIRVELFFRVSKIMKNN
ncbi:MAG: hypothetical protein HDR23_06975 [Lachnospiraceae bacterium]|nr:hypothetical protein [Lachnospiraceae bacterium]